MKYLSVVILLLFASFQLSTAGLLQDLRGKWTFSQDGITSDIIFKPLEKTGITIITTVKITNDMTMVITHKYHKNGKLDGNSKLNGEINETFSGTWKISKNMLRSDYRSISPNLSYKQTTYLTLINKNKIKNVTIYQDQNEMTGILRRISK